MACRDGLSVSLLPASGWKHGAYVFTLVVDGVEETCKGVLPLPSCGTPALSCDGKDVPIGESGCALPPSAHAFSSMHFSRTPERVEIRIERDGATVVDEVVTPTYQVVQPNGPNCGPRCIQANATVTLEDR